MLYRLILGLRLRSYRGRRTASAVPTVCIGNVTVGGTGKTPHVEMLLRLLDGAGRKVGVLSRGYGRKSRGFLEVLPQGPASLYGDEPLQIKRNFPDVPVCVDENRLEGCAKMASGMGIRTIILDDAFQHLKMKADMDIVLVDYSRPVFQDRLLPFGRLRDLPERIFEADCIIVTKCPELSAEQKAAFASKLRLKHYSEDATALTPEGKRIRVLFTKIKYDNPKPLENTVESASEFILFTGIANDAPLVKQLSQEGKIVEHFRFSDHHTYGSKDIRTLLSAARRHPSAAIVTTQKDAQRLSRFPESLRCRISYVPIRAEFLTEREKDLFLDLLSQKMG